LKKDYSSERGRSLAGMGVVLALLGMVILAVGILGGGTRLALADGQGSPAACNDGPNVDGNISPDSDDLATHTVAAGNVVTGVCIKSGQELGHTGPLANGTYDGNGNPVAPGSPTACYTVSGVGFQTVTVTRVGTGSDCQAISHIDVPFGVATPTPTSTPTNTPTNTPTKEPEATNTPSSTPTPIVAVITPPTTGNGGLSGGGTSVAWMGLASLIVGLGLLGWARVLTSRR
jgi:hypothetical protein